MIKLVITGAKGRMGSRIVALAKECSDLSVVGEIDRDDSLDSIIGKSDAIIDFSTAASSAINAQTAAEHGKPIVIGTTGLTSEQETLIRKASEKVAVVYAPNMSVGVNVMWNAARTVAEALGPDFVIDIEETHHVHKVDRPSGTAKRLIEMVTDDPSGVINIEDEREWNRTCDDGSVTCRSIRRGNVVGDHTIRFSSPYEELEISHKALTRDVFARGALTAARWTVGKPAGMYDMGDVLNLK